MRTEDLLEAIGCVDDELLERSEKVRIKKRISWKAWVPLAACICLIAGVKMIGLPKDVGLSVNDESAPMQEGENSIMGGTEDGDAPAEDSAEYAVEEESIADSSEAKGEVADTYTLFAAGETYDISVSRYITFTFETNHFEMKEQYLIFNNTSEDILMKLYHPNRGEFDVTVPGNGETEVVETQTSYGGRRFTVASDAHIEYGEIVAELIVDGNVDILDDTFGFELDAGKTKVELDSTKEYYIEVQ